ncbi:polycomb protein Scm isoform X2 [Euwallacea fornicatus]|uniref:polycomb protein Scm isoform X2 n=2 Tax=Euwallacea fornicatus TaxID=995702 RepID=UPI00338F7865
MKRNRRNMSEACSKTRPSEKSMELLPNGIFSDSDSVISSSESTDENCNRRLGLFSITDILKNKKSSNKRRWKMMTETPSESLEAPLSASKSLRRKRMDRTTSNSNGLLSSTVTDYTLHNNNNNVKNERLSPTTPDTSSRSRSATPSSACHSEASPAQENSSLLGSATGRNYSDFMRSLAAKYNHTNPNDYFNAARNGFPPPMDPRFKPSPAPMAFPSTLLPGLASTPTTKDAELSTKKADFASVLNPFSGAAAAMFPPLIDMSTTQTLLAMVKTAKEAELQGLLKNVKRHETSSPLDLSSAAPPVKRSRNVKTPSIGSPCNTSRGTPPNLAKRAESESPKLHEDVSGWSVEDVANFVGGIDICAEYAQNFRDQRIDGSGLPLLTEEHLTHTMGMKLGPALKLRSILGKKLGSCNVCLHCSHCHNNNSGNSETTTNGGGNTSDSGGAS